MPSVICYFFAVAKFRILNFPRQHRDFAGSYKVLVTEKNPITVAVVDIEMPFGVVA